MIKRSRVLNLVPLLASSSAAAQSTVDDKALQGLQLGSSVFAIIVLMVFFIPTIVAFSRDHSSRWAVFILNVVLGATIIGWIVALIWASVGEKKRSATSAEVGLENSATAAATPTTPAIEPQESFLPVGHQIKRAFNQGMERSLRRANQSLPTLADKITQLKKMRDSGDLTALEFEQLKEKVLNGL